MQREGEQLQLGTEPNVKTEPTPIKEVTPTEDGKEKRQGQGRQEVLTPTESDITGVKSGDVVAEILSEAKSISDAKTSVKRKTT